MERYLKAGSSFLCRQYAPHVLVMFLFCCMSGFFVSLRNLDALQAAKVMEMYFAFTGILLFTPLFMPEQDMDIFLLKRSKAMPLWRLYLIRLLEAVTLLTLVITVFILLMKQGGCVFSARNLWLGAFAEILFLGSIGYFVSAVTNQVVLGYMVSIIYFISNIGASKHLGIFGLFQMMRGEYGFAPVMLLAAAILAVVGIVIREKRAWS